MKRFIFLTVHQCPLAEFKDKLAEVLENKKLQSVRFDGNVNDEFAMIIASMLSEHKKLRHLSFQGGKESIGDNGVIALAPVFAKPSVQTLELPRNQIGSVGVAKILESKMTLAKLDLGSNILGHQGAIAIAKALETDQSITYLDLQNNKIGVEAGIEIGIALIRNQTLQTLLLRDNSLTWAGTRDIFAALKPNQSLQILDLSGNAIEYQDDPSLDFSDNQSLTELSLEGNPNLLINTTALIRSLPKNLTALSLKHCNMSRAVSPAIADLLSSNSCLTTLKLGVCHNNMLIEIAKALTNNQTLRHLYSSPALYWEAPSFRTFTNLLKENYTVTEVVTNPTDHISVSLERDFTKILDRNKNLMENLRFKHTKLAENTE